MYKVFIYNKPIFFTEESILPEVKDESIVFRCKTIKERDEILNDLKKNPRSLIVVGNKLKELKKLFFGDFKVVQAAGGTVVNPKGEMLFIYRNGYWDLPKGKIDSGEKKKVAAVREIEEECGIKNPIIKRKLITTYHCYKMDGKKFLKPTYWYEMSYAGDEKLIPQEEEGITEVKWVNLNDVDEQMSNTFEAIKDVIQQYKLS